MRCTEVASRSDPERFGAHMSTNSKTLKDIWCAFNDPNRDLVHTRRQSL